MRCLGMVFLGRHLQLLAPRGCGRLSIGADTHIGHYSAIRSHEGSVAIGSRCVLGSRVTINSYLDVSIGDDTLIADDVYIIDFDHRFADLTVPIKDQGIVKSPISIGHDCWLGTKVVVTRGVAIGDGAVVGAGSVVTGDVAPRAIVAGVPARVVGHRDAAGEGSRRSRD